MTFVLRVGSDPGYLSNKRMALEIAVGLAHLSGRRLSLPVDEPIGWGPRPALAGEAAGPPSSLRDLYDLPAPVLQDAAPTGPPARRPDWPDLAGAVLVDPAGADRDDLEAFANGRTVIALDPTWVDDPVLEVPGRALTYYSNFFLLDPEPRRRLFGLLEQIRLKEPYRDLARVVGEELGDYNAAHIRRTDHLVGVPDYRRVMPWEVRDNLAEVFPADQRLVVCTEADPASGFFAPLRDHFDDLVFLNDHLLGDGATRRRVDALPRHDDSALAAVSQAVAVAADRFVGTLSSTFTGIIHRERRLRDPHAPFLFTADFLGGSCRFEGCEYRAVHDGPYSWNRLGYPVSPDALSWMREWPEVRPSSSG